MSSRYRLEPVREASPSQAADVVGATLAANRGWVGAFLILLDGVDFKRLPGMTPGAAFFEGATRHDENAQTLLKALDDLYGEIRDGLAMSDAYGDMVEQYVWHFLVERFPDRLGSCRVLEDDEPLSSYVVDAATSAETPAVAVEAKSSERALVGRKDRRLHNAAKAAWVVSLRAETGDHVAGVFATFAPDEFFRTRLRALIGEGPAQEAVVVAREQLGALPNRVSALRQRLRPATD